MSMLWHDLTSTVGPLSWLDLEQQFFTPASQSSSEAQNRYCLLSQACFASCKVLGKVKGCQFYHDRLLSETGSRSLAPRILGACRKHMNVVSVGWHLAAFEQTGNTCQPFRMQSQGPFPNGSRG